MDETLMGETVLITDTGQEVLTGTPRELAMTPPPCPLRIIPQTQM